MNNICKHQGYSSKAKDTNKDLQYIYCFKHKEKCIGQRYCGKINKYIISENVNNYCRDYEAV